MANLIGYMGFESPMNQYSPGSTIPVLYTGAWQVRQFGAGDCLTQGSIGASYPYANITSGLYTVPADMAEAVSVSLTAATALYLQSTRDKADYGTTT